MQEYVERLAEFLKAKNITKSEFADSIGIGRPNVTHIFNGRYGLTDKVLSMIFRHYKELNPIWLLSGNGNMLIEQANEADSSDDVEENNGLLNFQEEKEVDASACENDAKDEAQPINNEDDIPASEPKISPSEWQNEKSPVSLTEISPAKTQERRIQKIVFFYNDKTFEEYFPE
ncbi:MAG: helix-turn-helix transcriptional regulator [Bacteroidales bacterium]|nr:helix-turn-helix transcriptional regulator [Bacteroidales bacterium]